MEIKLKITPTELKRLSYILDMHAIKSRDKTLNLLREYLHLELKERSISQIMPCEVKQ